MEIEDVSAPPSLGRQLVLSAAAAKDIAARLLEPHGLSLAQWAVLSSLWMNGPLSIKAIARLTGNAPPAASRIVDRMITGGLVLRQEDTSDRRAVVISLTDTGEAMRPLATLYEEVNAILLDGLDTEAERALFATLERVTGNARTWLAASPPDRRQTSR